MSLLAIDRLGVDFHLEGGRVQAVRDASLAVEKGETVALVGESGSGKSVTALSVMQLLPYPRASHPHGSIRFAGEELVGAPPERLLALRGGRAAMIFQEPMTSLNPLHSVERQISESLMLHREVSRQEARERTLELLRLVGLPDEERLDAWPHQLSGGQRQRVMIAMALANDPDLLIADEPTTALDVTIQAQILELLRDLQRRSGMAILLITHDLGIVRRVADRVYAMTDGEIVGGGGHRGDLHLPAPSLHPPAAGGRAAGGAGAGRRGRPGGGAHPGPQGPLPDPAGPPAQDGGTRQGRRRSVPAPARRRDRRRGRGVGVGERRPWRRRCCVCFRATGPSSSRAATSRAGVRRRCARCGGRCRSSSRTPSPR